ncbi:MAG: hypothetical protein ACR2LX_06005 [Jatrophihabitans sp.]
MTSASAIVRAALAGAATGSRSTSTLAACALSGLPARFTVGALSAGVLARRRRESIALAAGIGLFGAAATTFGGVRLRAAAADRFGSDVPGALIEDVVALAVAGTAARLR